MSTRFFIHLCIIITMFSSSMLIATLIFIDENIIIGKISLTNFTLSNVVISNDSLFRHPLKKALYINYSTVDSLNLCTQKYGPELTVKFNISDTIGILILVGIISIGMISLYLY